VASKLTSKRKASRSCLLLGLAFAVGARAATASDIPADIGVSLSASPSTNLVTGEQINITVSATNYGPSPAPTVVLLSSPFANEIGSFASDPEECFLFVTVVDAISTPYYFINWDVANAHTPGSSPLNPGETRTCHFQFALTQQAGPITTFDFHLATLFTDLNVANNIAAVQLRRVAPTPAPTLSLLSLLILVASLVACAARNLQRSV